MEKIPKGQSQVLEIVILFGIGLAVVSGFLAAFDDFGRNVKERAVDQQSRIMGDLVGSNIAFFLQTEPEDGSSVRFVIPRSLAGESYSINLSEQGVNILLEDNAYISRNLNGLEKKYEFQGSVSSNRETMRITLEDDKVTAGG